MDTSPDTGNPYNDQPTIALFDPDGGPLGHVSQRVASKMLRTGQAELLVQVPPAVRLLLPGPVVKEEAGPDSFLHARKGALYGNFHFQSPSGETMFHGDSEKALWYLNRDLVEVVNLVPPVLRFKFPPAGRGHAGDDYYLSGKLNRCVVCGALEDLNRHHVVPSVYRRHLPAEIKDHSHHDVLLLCLHCHEQYERAADEFKTRLGEEHGVPLHGLRGVRDRERNQVVKLAVALVRHREQIPLPRQAQMRQIIGDWLGRSEPTDADVAEVARMRIGDDGETIEHGARVIAATPDVQAFIRRWREHFVSTMQPRYLPEHWDVDRPAGRQEPGSD